MTTEGKLISELGVKKYLKGKSGASYSNIAYFDRGTELTKKWQECDFGCHGPSYRSLRHEPTWGDTVRQLNKIDPLLAGFADGVHHQTAHQVKVASAGIARTAEGLHLMGSEKFAAVGAENWAAYDVVNGVFTKLLSTEIDTLNNPLMQLVTVIVNDYLTAVPEWIIDASVRDGAIKLYNGMDHQLILQAASKDLLGSINSTELAEATAFLQNAAKRVVGKQMGKKVARLVASIIAVNIAKRIMKLPDIDLRVKRKLAALRQQSRSAKGGMGGALVVLLKSQGLLALAARASRELKQSCPTTWQHLRYKMNGCDMLYFLVQNPLQEYVDRLSLLEKDPQTFMVIMAELAKSKNTKDLFFPRAI